MFRTNCRQCKGSRPRLHRNWCQKQEIRQMGRRICTFQRNEPSHYRESYRQHPQLSWTSRSYRKQIRLYFVTYHHAEWVVWGREEVCSWNLGYRGHVDYWECGFWRSGKEGAFCARSWRLFSFIWPFQNHKLWEAWPEQSLEIGEQWVAWFGKREFWRGSEDGCTGNTECQGLRPRLRGLTAEIGLYYIKHRCFFFLAKWSYAYAVDDFGLSIHRAEFLLKPLQRSTNHEIKNVLIAGV